MDGLRQATVLDRARIEDLVARSYGGYVTALGVRPGPLDDDYGALIDAGHVRVVERAGALAALLVLIPLGDALLLDNIAVAPQMQGSGLGSDLLRVAEAVARAAGFGCVRLYTHEKMVRNQAIYARAGYHETRRVTERGLARVYMEKPLV